MYCVNLAETSHTHKSIIKKNRLYDTGMRLGFGKNSGKFYVAIDCNPIKHRRF